MNNKTILKESFSKEIYDVYELVLSQNMSDINSTGYLFKHIKSGARVAIIKNDDENKVFSINYRTPPKDSTGTPHIIEHSVLCGSKKYPLKDPFVELVKGSLNTFLNAMTFSDKTMYPVASCNDKDFANLMSVYMDAVFYPAMKHNKYVFWQEGWHYEMENEEAPLTVNGVVYNEMRGVFSSPEQQLERLVQKTLFEDNAYGFESGGDPDDIPDLSYEAFLDFYNRYYHPSNSYIYLYGDIDIEERLLWMDREYLNKFNAITIDSTIKEQKPFDAMKIVNEKYSAQSDEDKAYFSYNCVVDSGLDNVTQLAFNVLSYALVAVPGAPVKEALTEAGIADDISGSYDCEVLQPVFSIEAGEAVAEKSEKFVAIIRETLTDLVKNGIDKKSLEAAVSYYEFRYREADFGRYPKGLMYGINMMQTWLYDDNDPFSSLLLNDAFAKLRELVNTDYFEKLTDRYLLNNPHTAVVNVFPEAGLSRKKDEALAKRLAEYKKTLSEEEIKNIVEETRKLKEYQETPDSKEALMTIPLLKREDIKKDISILPIEEKECNGSRVLHHNMFTNDIAYVRFAFDVSEYKEYLPYINLLAIILGSIDTKKFTYLELSNEINLHTGGINIAPVVRARNLDISNTNIQMEVTTRVLYSSMKKSFELIGDIINESVFTDKKRIRDILAEVRSDCKSSMEAMGNSTAVSRSMSYFSETAYYNNMLTGVSFYRFIDHLYNHYEELCDECIDIMKALLSKIFNRDNLIVSITCNAEGYAEYEKCESVLIQRLFEKDNSKLPAMPEVYEQKRGKLNEGFTTPGKVQYVARSGNFINNGYKYSGGLKILRTILGYGYLWQNVRVTGGAYGASCGFTITGNGYFSSYRDPKLAATNDVFANVPAYIRSFDVDEREMTKYIIGTMSDEDAPITPSTKGRVAFSHYITGVTDDMRQKERDEILSAGPETIRGYADLIQSVIDDDYLCVVGSESAIEENSDLFMNIEKLS